MLFSFGFTEDVQRRDGIPKEYVLRSRSVRDCDHLDDGGVHLDGGILLTTARR